jgi:hypothetical protein
MSWAKPKPPRSDEEVQRLMRLVLAEPTVAGRLRDLHPMGDTRKWSGANFFTAVWHAAAGSAARGGGSATRLGDHGLPVLVKIGGEAREQWWAEALGREAPELLPTVYATGAALGGQELPWIVMERCPYGIEWSWGMPVFTMLFDSGVRFQMVGRRVAPPVDAWDVRTRMYDEQIRRGATFDQSPPGPAAAVVDRLERDWKWALRACRVELCHGDLHPANAVYRTAPPDPATRTLLVDFAPHALPWVWEPAYCQVLYWPAGSRAGETAFARQMATVRRTCGLDVPPSADLDRLETLFLAWNAIRFWPLLDDRRANPDYVATMRRWLEACAAL